MFYLGVDLGGTNIASAVVTGNGEILAKASIPTGLPAPAEVIADRIDESCRLAVAKSNIPMDEIRSIGIGAPGITNPNTGIIEYSCNLDFHNTPLAKLVGMRFDKPILLENDANAAALGEYVAGSGKGTQSMVAVTLGTGVGGGIVVNNRLLTGFNYAGGEIGHFVISYGGEPCSCGRRGCLEAYCSATALIRQTRRAMARDHESLLWKISPTLEAVEGITVFTARDMGDSTAAAVIDEYISYLACGISSLINIFQPEVLCIGGGISNQGERLLAPLRVLVDQEDYARNSLHRTRLVTATLGNDAGIIGAALLPLYR